LPAIPLNTDLPGLEAGILTVKKPACLFPKSLAGFQAPYPHACCPCWQMHGRSNKKPPLALRQWGLKKSGFPDRYNATFADTTKKIAIRKLEPGKKMFVVVIMVRQRVLNV
jgi:hypothetical protein